MIGILLLIFHIIVFGAVGFVLGVAFEWQYAKQNTLLDCKKNKVISLYKSHFGIWIYVL